ncbi:hypothetical protein GGI25_004177 [Coemansia spiralis]|uniref:EamA domain-containing protein n=2 Tax=Coemansia TaxID=4863 RepID=A0A9W8G5D4_9FUNG|nr:hypothetical protein EDC05_005597 [Coemansia umbellata]KAJ2618958.1 hypothetical protein GGI26_006218 [Coemansia sp. RSA 1358]KAJ2675029.1 hypothetical protein GGI25_004177 [Coemansia spiralis]
MAPVSSSISQPLLPSTHTVHTLRTQQSNKALVFSALSALAFALMSLLVRLAQQTHKLTALQIMSLRCTVQAILALALCALKGISLRIATHNIKWVMGRAGFGLLGHLLYYMSLGGLSMGIANVLFFTNPLFTALIAHWFLGEQFTKKHGWTAVCCLLGIVMVVMPSVVDVFVSDLGWSLYALLGAMSASLAYVSVRGAGSSVHAMVHVAYFGITGAMGGFALSFISREPWPQLPSQSGIFLCLCLGIGVFAFLAQYLMNRGLQLANAGPVVMMRYIDTVIGFVFDILLFHSPPSLTGITGATIITISLLLLVSQ